MASLRDRYNDMLDRSDALSRYGDLRDAAADARRSHLPALLLALVLGGICSLLISFLVSVLGFGNQPMLVAWSLVGTAANILVSNIVFAVFLARVRDERLGIEAVRRIIGLFGIQVLCAIVLMIAQNLVTNGAGLLAVVDARLYSLAVVAISVAFTLLNALVAFRVYDGVSRFGDILPGVLRVLSNSGRALLLCSLPFLVWTFAANIGYAMLFSGLIPKADGIPDVFHLLLNAHAFALLGEVAAYNLVNLAVGSLLEIGLLLGLASCYERDRSQIFGS